MKTKALLVIAAPALALLLSGCGTTTASRTASGAAAGAATGALIGSASANAGRGALIGAGVGAIGGALYDSHQKEVERDQRRADAEAARRGY